jgi:predicted amidohydrolase YtcJ
VPKPRLTLLAAVSGLGLLSAQTKAPDLVIVNARIYTVNPAMPTAEALAIGAGHVTAVGTSREIRGLAGAQTRVLDAEGRTIIPGLQDNHLHSAGGGPGVDLSSARSLEEVLGRIETRVKQAKAGEIVTTNADWHEAQLKEQRLPFRKDLDAIAPDTPVVVIRGGHEYILNSAALTKWGISKSTPEPRGGRITRDEKGELNGELVDRAKALAPLPEPAPPTIESLRAEHQKLNAAGLTSIRYPGAPIEHYRLLQEMEKRGLLTIRVNHLLRPAAATPAALKGLLDKWGVKPDEGDEWLRNGGLKFAVDGGFEGGWMTDLYAKPFDEGGRYRGINTLPLAEFRALVQEANRGGWRVATHAVGDAAVDEVLAGYEAADGERSIRGRRWSIEHAFLPRADQFPEMKKLSLAISVQDHLYLAGPSLVKMWGPQRAARVTPVRAYLDEGIEVSGGTDSPVVPYPPLWVFYHWVSRETIAGGVLGPDQRISRQEALRVETLNNAYLTFEERIKGSIEPGKLADLVMLGQDIMTMPAGEIPSTKVLMTMVGGKIVYQREGFQAAISRR